MALPARVRGTAYELACQRELQRMLGAVLVHSGGTNDGGVDLSGWWTPMRDRVRVLVQCKAEAKKVGPAYVRELEGTALRAAWDRSRLRTEEAYIPTAMPLGVLASASGFSRAALLYAQSSQVPLALIHLSGTGSGAAEFDTLKCHGLVWNDALSGPNGILKGHFEQRWSLHTSSPILLLDGHPIAAAS
ncbi:hypothetical protein MCUN1_001139 [Malassezia cuniculi]|uniref:Restriction endonuclease type IV Mrr domain-containing protein n=1 Tax=Malassezia cuniculi TaxID=948313 RepID=A0AAF0EQ56_9BASI|nr:hypothetical protein MCUN1_001139 [Malassezia cuniculi]